MFDRLPTPPLPSLLRPPGWGRRGIERGVRLLIGLAVAFSASAALGVVSPSVANAAGGDPATGPSIQYQEALAHAAEPHTFTRGAAVTVPFRPRPGDSRLVDGAPQIALPAGAGSPSATPGAQTLAPNVAANILRREVLGFLPYWELSGTSLNYDALSTIAYFGVDLKLDGTLNTSSSGWNGWVSSNMTSVINNAHTHGTRVALTIQSFAWDSAGQAAQSTILSSPSISLNAAQQIAAEVGRRGADGVNLDFEPIASGQRSNFVTFVRTLRIELDKVHPGYELTFCANGAPGTYDLPNLLADGAADAVFIMAYNLRGGSPANTGSIDPLESPFIRYDLVYVTNTFTSQVPVSKIILGLPWYGEAWSTGATNAVNAPPADIPTYGAPANPYYSKAKAIANQVDPDVKCSAGPPATCLGWQYDVGEQTAWTAYYGNFGGTQNTWRELYFDDARAVSAKCDAIDAWNLRGIGIWALGYDSNNGGDGDLMNAIAAKFLTQATPATYHPMAPVRILDTRNGTGLGGAFPTGQARSFAVAGVKGIPADATAVTGNVTVTMAGAAGNLRLGPSVTGTFSTVNFNANDTRANGVTLGLSTTGTLSAIYSSYTGSGTAQVVFDVTGFFTPDTSGATFVPLTPARLLDTRVANGLSGKFISGVPRTFAVSGRGGVPANATAVTGNLTVTDASFGWAVALGPDPLPSPTTSTVNFSGGQTIANGVTVALGSGGTLSATYLSSAYQTTNLVFDVTGYFVADSSGTRYVAMTPTRLLDTRASNGLSGKFTAKTPRSFAVMGRGGVPIGAAAVTGNLTVTDASSGYAVFLGPNPTSAPSTSTINFLNGDTRANGVTVALAGDGTLSATYLSTPTQTTSLVFDVTGYFAP